MSQLIAFSKPRFDVDMSGFEVPDLTGLSMELIDAAQRELGGASNVVWSVRGGLSGQLDDCIRRYNCELSQGKEASETQFVKILKRACARFERVILWYASDCSDLDQYVDQGVFVDHVALLAQADAPEIYASLKATP
ncbi:hypothetical protein [Maricaulis sp.]|uniref:hypothetical protein n=1 Tax=Maricaulis sp. TaxID=1486257 RepID=UPI00262DE8BF|nr:hypothetical protein [Maricaulis sp.]MDF1768962.1 hypothetical protein [Maricaulis sp.]